MVCDRTLFKYCKAATSRPIVLFDDAMSETLSLRRLIFNFDNVKDPNPTRTSILRHIAEFVMAKNQTPVIVLNHMADYVKEEDAQRAYIFH